MTRYSFLFLILLLVGLSSNAQEFQYPSEGKSLIYFVRSSGTGAAINFKYFHDDQYLGKMNGVNYFIYECDPGEHLFWVAAENRDYIQGELKANSTYVIQVKPTMGAFKAAVKLHQVAPNDEKVLKKVNRVLSKKAPKILKGQEDDLSFFIENGMDRYHSIKDQVKRIVSDWTF